MNEFPARLGFMWRLAEGWLKKRTRCPACGGAGGPPLARKHVLAVLRRCSMCDLLYRCPTDPPRFGRDYYQEDYHEGFTTDMPDKDRLTELVATEFRGIDKCFQSYIELLRRLGVRKGANVLDYGCSWGYGAWQFKQAGYKVQGFEISRRRGNYARDRLGIPVLFDESELSGGLDVFFTSHVLEHLPNPQAKLSLAHRLLKPDGILLAITPNGSLAYRKLHEWNWMCLWGRKHPVALDEVFYARHLKQWSCMLGGAPAEMQAAQLPEGGLVATTLAHSTLTLVARKCV